MTKIAISEGEFSDLLGLRIKHRWDWPAVFSVNPGGTVWPWVAYGYTHREIRRDVRGLSRVVDRAADALLRENGIGGRFFIDVRGAFHKQEGSALVQFAVFEFRSGRSPKEARAEILERALRKRAEEFYTALQKHRVEAAYDYLLPLIREKLTVDGLRREIGGRIASWRIQALGQGCSTDKSQPLGWMEVHLTVEDDSGETHPRLCEGLWAYVDGAWQAVKAW